MLGISYILVRRDRALDIPVLAREISDESYHCNHNCRGRVGISKPSASRSMQGVCCSAMVWWQVSYHYLVATLRSSLLLWNRVHLEETKQWEEGRVLGHAVVQAILLFSHSFNQSIESHSFSICIVTMLVSRLTPKPNAYSRAPCEVSAVRYVELLKWLHRPYRLNCSLSLWMCSEEVRPDPKTPLGLVDNKQPQLSLGVLS